MKPAELAIEDVPTPTVKPGPSRSPELPPDVPTPTVPPRFMMMRAPVLPVQPPHASELEALDAEEASEDLWAEVEIEDDSDATPRFVAPQPKPSARPMVKGHGKGKKGKTSKTGTRCRTPIAFIGAPKGKGVAKGKKGKGGSCGPSPRVASFIARV